MLLNVYFKNLKTKKLLLIPLALVWNLRLSHFEKVTDFFELNEQFGGLKTSGLIYDCGMLIPLKNLNYSDFSDGDGLIDLLKVNQKNTNEVFKAKWIECDIEFFDDLFEINRLFSENASRIKYYLCYYNNESILRNFEGDITVLQANMNYGKLNLDFDKLRLNLDNCIWNLKCLF